jgi:hypothetical protein
MSDERDEKNDPKDGRDRRPRRDDSSSRPNSGRPSSGRPSSGRFGAPNNGNDRSSDGRPPRDGERKPFNRDAKPGERKPFSRDAKPGERKPFNRDAKPGERKPFSRDGRPPRDGERKPFNRDAKPGERKPFSRDGRPPRDGERKPFNRDAKPGERKPFSRDGRPPRDGERKPFSRDGRPPRDGERKPFTRDGRPPRDGDRKPFSRDGRPPAGRPEPREEEFPRFRPSEEQRKAIRDLEPEIENRFAGKELDRAVLRDLSTLSEDNAMVVGRHLEAAAFYAEIDAPRALQHAIAAKNRASRLAVVRETVGIMAYVNEDFTLALAELRTAQRISGSNDQVALIIDCLRGLGRSDEGLKLARDVDRAALPREAQVDLAIVLSGIRLDRTETDRAYAELQIPQLDPTNATAECVALFDANAEVLEEMGRMDEAAKWRRYARLTEDHFSPDETIEFHTEYLETPTDVTAEGLDDSDDEPELALSDSELSDLVGDVQPPATSKDDE